MKSRPLAKSLNKTSVEKGTIMDKTIQLTLGRSQIEWERMNGGIFLYWHGRLIEVGFCLELLDKSFPLFSFGFCLPFSVDHMEFYFFFGK